MNRMLYALAVGLCLLCLPNLLTAQCDVTPSIVTTSTGLGYLEIDSTDSQVIDLMTNSTANANYIYALTGTDFNIIRFINGPSADISDLNAGKYFIWGFSYTGTINLVPGQLVFTGSFSTGCFQISNTAVVIQKLNDGGSNPNPCANVNGGSISLQQGGTSTTITIDSVADSIIFNTTFIPSPGVNFTYVITDSTGTVISVSNNNFADFNLYGVGVSNVFGLAYTGNLLVMVGDNIDNLTFSDDCFSLTSNFLTITQDSATVVTGQFFVSSNTSGMIGVYSMNSDGTISMDNFPSQGADADGIYYDVENDVLYQLSRTGNVVNAYSNVNASLAMGNNPTLTATSTSDFTNGREIAALGGRIVVTQDADPVNNNMNRLLVYDATSTSITLVNTYDVDINLWGVAADAGTLYAVVDNSNKLAVYDNFFSNPDGAISPTMTVTVDGIVRTHGLTYNADMDIMYMTDVADAGSNSDGAFVIIHDFMNAIADSVVTMSEQIRVSGPMSMLGNPVDIAYDPNTDMIFVAERANGSGRILGFEMPTVSGDMAPTYNGLFPGASAINFPSPDGMMAATAAHLFVSSNTQSKVAVVSVLDNNVMDMSTFNAQGMDADGIYYDRDNDLLYQFNRSANVVNTYTDVAMSIDAGNDPMLFSTSTADAINGREIAVSGDRLVVAQDAIAANGDTNKFLVYNINNGALTLDKTFDVDVNLWGIHADGETLYAVVDNSNLVVRYDDFFSQPAGALSATDSVEIEGLVRTHGLTYDASIDAMILTDVGDAASDSDGAIIVISNWTTASADGTVSMAEQIRVEGDMTFLGNPVDVAWDKQRSMIYVAERLNGGGRILGFRLPAADGNMAPIYNELFAGASAVYLNDADGQYFQGGNGGHENFIFANPSSSRLNNFTLAAYPNPVSNYMTLQWSQLHAENGDEATIRIVDINGHMLQQRSVAVWEGTVSVGMIVSDLQSGLYHVIVNTSEGTMYQRFIKE
ncbi:MAG: T9SS type A sorting domain-containing protein [Bacteroidetes bacterium]|nr:T9SS type A sorting domain-containing protein [Bacteroidota bacterium]